MATSDIANDLIHATEYENELFRRFQSFLKDIEDARSDIDALVSRIERSRGNIQACMTLLRVDGIFLNDEDLKAIEVAFKPIVTQAAKSGDSPSQS